jgi:hypothetical protein
LHEAQETEEKREKIFRSWRMAQEDGMTPRLFKISKCSQIVAHGAGRLAHDVI